MQDQSSVVGRRSSVVGRRSSVVSRQSSVVGTSLAPSATDDWTGAADACEKLTP
jgi:hypothetical protein